MLPNQTKPNHCSGRDRKTNPSDQVLRAQAQEDQAQEDQAQEDQLRDVRLQSNQVAVSFHHVVLPYALTPSLLHGVFRRRCTPAAACAASGVTRGPASGLVPHVLGNWVVRCWAVLRCGTICTCGVHYCAAVVGLHQPGIG